MILPVIDTIRLRIRPLTAEDLHAFHVYRSNPEVVLYQGFDVMNPREAAQFINDNLTKSGNPGEWVQYGIEQRNSNTLIGDCALSFHADDPSTAEIGITISHFEQRKGYAKEVLAGLRDFLFSETPTRRIVETTDAENTASIQLLKSLGFRKEGDFVENIFFKGKWGSERQYALLKREWEELMRNRKREAL